MLRRAALFAILVWLALDLSTPDIPGAFVFDADGSIDSVDAARTRVEPKTVVLPVVPRISFVPLRDAETELVHRLPQRRDGASAGALMVWCLPRATCAPVRSTEDPD